MNTIKKSYYAIIPANVRYDKRLTPNAKLLYGEITALCNEKGFCWATNSYFADLYNVSKTSISQWVGSLVENGYVSLEIVYKEGSKEILHRYLRLITYPIQEILHTPIQENLKDNNTGRILQNNKKEKEKEKEKCSAPNGFDFDSFFLSFKEGWSKKCKDPSTDGVYEFVLWKEGDEGRYKNLLREQLYKDGVDTNATARAILDGIKVYQKHFEYKTPTKYRNSIEKLIKASYWKQSYDLPQKAQQDLRRQEMKDEFEARVDKFTQHYGDAGQNIKNAIKSNNKIFEFFGTKQFQSFSRISHDWLVYIEGGRLVWEVDNEFEEAINKYITRQDKDQIIINIINSFIK